MRRQFDFCLKHFRRDGRDDTLSHPILKSEDIARILTASASLAGLGSLEPGRKLELPLGLLLRYREFMAKSIRDIAKRRAGRPKTTGPGTGIMVKMHHPHLGELDAWIAKQKPKPSRPEAIRRLVELGLRVKK
jgi:hypothetical protein